MILWFYSDKLFPWKLKLAFFLSLNSQAYSKKVLFVILQSFKLYRIDTWINSLFFSSLLSTACSRYFLTFLLAIHAFTKKRLICPQSESCGLVGSEDGSRSKGHGFNPGHQYTRCKWCQSHTGLINAPSQVLPSCFKWLLTNRVSGSKKKILPVYNNPMTHFSGYKIIIARPERQKYFSRSGVPNLFVLMYPPKENEFAYPIW